jgi:hypothetical protein
MKAMMKAYRISVKSQKERDYNEDLIAGGRIMLKLVVE